MSLRNPKHNVRNASYYLFDNWFIVTIKCMYMIHGYSPVDGFKARRLCVSYHIL